MKNFSKLIVAGALSVSMLSSCHIYKKFEMPQEDPATAEYARVAAETPDSTAYGNLQWQQVFTDPLLQDFISRALANNVNLDNARLNIDIARANLLGAKLSYLPSVALNPNGAGAKYNLPGASMTWTYTIPMAASWEIDVFGKILNNKRAAEVNVELQNDYAQAVRSQIIGGVASCYYSIATIESQLELSRQTSEVWAKSVQTMRDFKETGRVTEAAVVQSEAQYYSILASITDLETALRQANNSMSLLLNEQPQIYAIPADARLDVPAILRDGIALREIAQRPDVRVAEKNLAAAYYNTNLARAAFYPGLTISAQGGFSNLLGSFIKNPGDWFIQLAGQLTAPLFARGQNIARLKGAKVQQEQSMNNFKYALLNAAAEIDNALVSLANNTTKAEMLAKQEESLQKAVDYTNLLMAHDQNTTYLEVLTAQSSLLQAQMGRLSTELNRQTDLITLYQALGGGR